jgi:hypothetical protein
LNNKIAVILREASGKLALTFAGCFVALLLCSLAPAQTTLSTQRDNNTAACSSLNSPVVGAHSCSANTQPMSDDCSIPNSGNCNSGAKTKIFNEAPANVADETNDGMDLHDVPYAGFNGKVFAHWTPWFDGPGSNGNWLYTPKLPNPPGENTFSNHAMTGYSSHNSNQVRAELNHFCRMGVDGFIIDWDGMQFSAASTTRKNEDAALQTMVADLGTTSCASSMKFSAFLDQAAFETGATCGTSSQTPSCAEKVWEDSLDWANLSTSFTSALDGNTYTGKGYTLNSHYLWMNCNGSACSFTAQGTGHPVFGSFVSESSKFTTCTGGSPCAVWNDNQAGTTCTSSSDCWTKIWAGISHHVTNSGYAATPYFIYRNTFSHAAPNDGSYRWVNPTTTQSDWDKSGYDTWLTTGSGNPQCNSHTCVTFGAAYKGVDHAQSGFQSDHLIVDQQCGKVWLNTLKEAATQGFGTGNQMQAFQVNTYNDYDEGTEVQTGIDSCYSVTAAMASDGHTLGYTLSTANSTAAPLSPLNSTLDHLVVYYSTDSITATQVTTISPPLSSGTVDIAGMGVPTGAQVYVKLVGAPFIKNMFAAAVPGIYSGSGSSTPPVVQIPRLNLNTQIKALPATDVGSANAYSISVPAMGSAYFAGMPVAFTAANANTTTSTINVNSIGAVTIKKQGGTADLASGDIQAGALVVLIYDGTYFQMQSQLGNSSSGGGVTSIATTSPVTGGTITSTGTIACPTCVTSAASLTSGQLMAGAGSQASQVTNLSGDVTTSGGAATTVVKVNGVAYSASPSTDTIPVVTASNTATYKAVPDCQDSTGNHLNYTASTHAISCGTSSWSSGVSTTGSPSSGNLSKFSGPSSITNADLSGDVTTSGTAVTIAAKINGTSVPTNAAADQVIVTTASATGAWKTLTNCANDGGHAVTYDTTTHTFSCTAITASGVSGGFAWGGDGSDGSVTADGSTTLACLGAPSSSIYTMTRDCSFSGLTVNNGVTVLTSNFALYVQGTLTVNSGGSINNNGSTGNVGQNAGSSTGGTGGSLTNAAGSGTPSHYLRLTQSKAGTAGGNGGTAAGTQAGAANAGNNTSNAVDSTGTSGSSGNNGGVGGTGTSGAGGAARSGAAGGTVTSVAEVTGHNANAAYWGSYLNSGVPAGLKQYGTLSAGNGGAPGGSGGGGDTTNAGGGGGGGGGEGGYGGILAIFAATISNSGTISANGGTGGVGGNGRTQTLGNVGGGGGGAGGSGGNGGIVWLVYKSLTNSGTISANGGSGGNGGTKGSPHGTGTDNAANGDNGPTGKAGIVIQIAN